MNHRKQHPLNKSLLLVCQHPYRYHPSPRDGLKQKRNFTMAACELKPEDKKAFIGAVGEELVKCHGKKKYYKPEEISRAASTRGYSVDIHCWAYCFFSSPIDFRTVHAQAGEACDYTAMKAELLTALSDDSSFQLADLNLSWLEWPDIDLSSLFDWS